MKRFVKNKKFSFVLLAIVSFVVALIVVTPSTAIAGNICGNPADHDSVTTSIDLGCSGQGNPIMDLTFAIIRLISAGVGIAVVLSVIVAGIQFSAARSDPQAAASAITRLRSSLIALIIFIFAYAILNFVIPGGFFS